ncbi:hypothetical protein LJC59_08830 [Desulfovibrio sp. OttesenSCG-928-A18]|nr:hypothetical protein [Desulfovibrio sp. OttesenSCG-928-A18]
MSRRTMYILLAGWLLLGAYLFYETMRQAQTGSLPPAWTFMREDSDAAPPTPLFGADEYAEQEHDAEP